MNSSGIGAAQPFQPVSPFSPHSKPAVGLESSDSKDQTLPPVEETGESDRLRERLGQRVGAIDGEGDPDSNNSADGDQPEQQSADSSETPVADLLDTIPLSATLRPVAMSVDSASQPATTAAKALDQFQQVTQQRLSPGLLLDQET
jgi:hypothetical protein